MNKLLELQLSVWKLTGTINRLQALETRSTDEDTELTTATAEYADVNGQLVAEGEREQTRIAAARTAHPDPELREQRALCSRANLGEIMTAVLERRSVDGANLEVQQSYGLGTTQIPLDMLRVETRAVTPSIGNVATEEAEVLTPVFATGAGAFLGVDRPTVPQGDAVYPVLTTRPTVGGPYSGDDDVAETTGGYSADLLAPERIQASFIYKRVDLLRFPAMDPSLRMALNMGLEEKIDYEVIAGSDGLLNGMNLANHNVSAISTFANYLSEFCFGRVDGRYAAEQGEVRAVMGQATYGHAGGVYQATPHQSALDVLMDKLGGVRVSAHVPAAAGNKQNSVIRLGMRRDMVQPTWVGVTIIVDEYGTLAGKGEIEVTAVLGMNTKILRAEGFYKQQTQHS